MSVPKQTQRRQVDDLNHLAPVIPAFNHLLELLVQTEGKMGGQRTLKKLQCDT
jgi:hypothetical protein